MKKRSEKIFEILKNKYVLALIIFIVWVSVFDTNNLIDRFQMIWDRNQLTKDKNYYQERIEQDTKRLKELKTNNENLEKFAREQYLMKKDDEDIFVIVEEDK
ncbi:MAG TPA: septum formation initiator family protein [Bacteroidales bacterium]|nr:septum formation initiator family protein [Bacteroidales bacterium]